MSLQTCRVTRIGHRMTIAESVRQETKIHSKAWGKYDAKGRFYLKSGTLVSVA
jgi:hypothetical protein